MTPPREPWALFNAISETVKGWVGRPPPSVAAPAALEPPEPGFETPVASLGGCGGAVDGSDLLIRRMRALHLGLSDLDSTPGRVLGVRTGLCAHCEARGKCMRGLDDEFSDPDWGDWRNYCPNATALTILSTLRECVRDEQEQPTSS